MNLFDWGNITTNIYIALIITMIILYMIIFHLKNIIGEKNARIVHDITEKCVISCSDKKLCSKVNNLRDSGYYIFDENPEKCIVTKWEISHLIFHMFLGYFTNIYISQGISVGFELYEHYILNCGSYLDLGYNFIGFIIGHKLKKYTK